MNVTDRTPALGDDDQPGDGDPFDGYGSAAELAAAQERYDRLSN